MAEVTNDRYEKLLHKEVFTTRELAELLGATEDFLHHEVWRGDLKAIRFGHDILRFNRHDVLEWLAAREQGQAR